MTWTVIVPLKPPGCRKARLAPLLSPAQRDQLALDMFQHVTSTLAEVGTEVIVLSPLEPQGWRGRWHRDAGLGLNIELGNLQQRLIGPWAVVHADLPSLCGDDVAELLSAAEQRGLALAPDRQGSGTNAVAVADGRRLAFRFGPGSLAMFAADAGQRHALVHAHGLAADVDTPDDLTRVARRLPTRGALVELTTRPTDVTLRNEDQDIKL